MLKVNVIKFVNYDGGQRVTLFETDGVLRPKRWWVSVGGVTEDDSYQKKFTSLPESKDYFDFCDWKHSRDPHSTTPPTTSGATAFRPVVDTT